MKKSYRIILSMADGSYLDMGQGIYNDEKRRPKMRTRGIERGWWALSKKPKRECGSGFFGIESKRARSMLQDGSSITYFAHHSTKYNDLFKNIW